MAAQQAKLRFRWPAQGSCTVKSTAWKLTYDTDHGPQEPVQPTHCVVSRLMWRPYNSELVEVTVKDMCLQSLPDGDERPLATCGTVSLVNRTNGEFVKVVNAVDVARELAPAFDTMSPGDQAALQDSVTQSSATLWQTWVSLWTNVPRDDLSSDYYVSQGRGAIEDSFGCKCSRLALTVQQDASEFVGKARDALLSNADTEAERADLESVVRVTGSANKLQVLALVERETLRPFVVQSVRICEAALDLYGTSCLSLLREMKLSVFGFADVMPERVLDATFDEEVRGFVESTRAARAAVLRDLREIFEADALNDEVPPTGDVGTIDDSQIADVFGMLDSSRVGYLTPEVVRTRWPAVFGEELSADDVEEMFVELPDRRMDLAAFRSLLAARSS